MLADVLTAMPHLRRRRALNAADLRWLLGRESGQCTWCGASVGARRTWCSDDCVREFKLHCDSGAQAAAVLARDQKSCVACGRDTDWSERIYRHIEKWARREIPHSWDQMFASVEWARDLLGFGRGRWREVDHIVPVTEGGGLCGIDNLRTLCGACHAVATAALAKRKGRKGRK